MRNLIRAELLQLRTLRSTWGALALVLALGVGITIGDFSEAGGENLDTFSEMRDALIRDVGLVAALVFAMLAALRVGGEYRHDTMAQRVMAAPRRGRIVVAKLAVYAVVAAVTSAAVAAVAAPVAKAVASSRDVTFALSGSDIATVAAQVSAGAALFAMIGVAVAFITRSQPVAVMIVYGGYIVEQILAGLVGDVAQYLPFALLNSTLGMGELSPAPAVLALAGVTAGVIATGTTLLARRDV
jgi:hypothetical protein